MKLGYIGTAIKNNKELILYKILKKKRSEILFKLSELGVDKIDYIECIDLIKKKLCKKTKEPKTEPKRTKNQTKKNQKEPLRTKWQFWYFPYVCILSSLLWHKQATKACWQLQQPRLIISTLGN